MSKLPIELQNKLNKYEQKLRNHYINHHGCNPTKCNAFKSIMGELMKFKAQSLEILAAQQTASPQMTDTHIIPPTPTLPV